jgi:hypothetical protein
MLLQVSEHLRDRVRLPGSVPPFFVLCTSCCLLINNT